MADSLYDTELTRTSHLASKYGTNIWDYINQTARPEFAVVRTIINEWYKRYPQEHRFDLRRRFQSKDNYQHLGALFELYCHELLIRHGYTVDVHARSNTKTTRPDFLASRGNSSFYLEATIVTKGEKEHKAILRRAAAFDAINAMDLPQCYVSVSIENSGTNTIPPKVIRPFLIQEYNNWRKHGSDPHYRVKFDWGGWQIDIGFIHSNGKTSGARTIGIESMGHGFVGTSTSLPQGIANKTARKYDCAGLPYVVAVNAVDEFAADFEDITQALFGLGSRASRMPDEKERAGRNDCGAWFDQSGYRERGQSAVLFVQGLVDWTIFSTNPILLHHPLAFCGLFPGAFRLGSAQIKIDGTNSYHFSAGEKACDILGIPTSLASVVSN